jgi:hypothetical protein
VTPKKFYDVDTKHSASGSMNVSGSIIVVKIPTAPTQAKTAYIAGRFVAPYNIQGKILQTFFHIDVTFEMRTVSY